MVQTSASFWEHTIGVGKNNGEKDGNELLQEFALPYSASDLIANLRKVGETKWKFELC